ncbi:hypothetical protein EVAR_29045_1 [Eumeta japonica]|uniref:Uncharacterized protein n=1 Tax=Eumeta variegata TaxID=151549 RepID=A0A4C1W5E4_EUMVA|nr:hypothetical protein EVAR_29045_1 [Eumeta japonica]
MQQRFKDELAKTALGDRRAFSSGARRWRRPIFRFVSENQADNLQYRHDCDYTQRLCGGARDVTTARRPLTVRGAQIRRAGGRDRPEIAHTIWA